MFHKTAILHQTLALLPISIEQVLMGCMLGWSPMAFYYLRLSDSAVSATEEECNWIISLQQIGRIAVSIPGGMIADKIGRKWVIIITGVSTSITWLLLSINTSLYILYALNLSLGIAYGIGNSIFQIYMAELVSARSRGTFSSLSICYFSLGSFLVNIFGALLSFWYMNFLTWCISVAFFPAMYFICESPSYLISKNQEEKARSNFNWLREGMSKDQIEEEFLKIKANVENQKKHMRSATPLGRLMNKSNRYSLLIVLLLSFLIPLTGNAIIKLNSAFIFPKTEYIKDVKNYPFIITCIELPFNFIAPLLIERINRRALTIISSVICSVILAFSGMFFYIYEKTNINIPDIQTLLFATVLLYCVVYIASLFVLLSLIRAEILPHSIRGLGSGVVVAAQSLSLLLSVNMFTFVTHLYGVYLCFVIYSLISLSVALIAYLWLPETRGRTLTDIQEQIGKLRNVDSVISIKL